ncbi:type I-F CRISPR-associated endoribonuclease Cas6/Csy4 [Prodigiosinella aquatilis]|nr:type I-F CRISPR-associated endoribonuclease Cas6/Csy4 [Prodigiosinella sp. LS101]WJV56140.1 type I-F CRISPR-associated endoribonuclease Cas6/Csy4 [Prodigiosinella sp. LS101]WJV60507.1 type I-F CRISPR-associated endoribonuclease Cas6/Csy4 [Pectobacteriaceae bacterium C111]
MNALEHGPIQDCPSVGKFSAYGLSMEATIPWF